MSLQPVASALTKAVQDVVKIIEIVVAFLHVGPIAHGVVEPAVGICHCAHTGRGDKGQRQGHQTISLLNTEQNIQAN